MLNGVPLPVIQTMQRTCRDAGPAMNIGRRLDDQRCLGGAEGLHGVVALAVRLLGGWRRRDILRGRMGPFGRLMKLLERALGFARPTIVRPARFKFSETFVSLGVTSCHGHLLLIRGTLSRLGRSGVNAA